MALPHPRQRQPARAGPPRLPQHRVPRRRARLRRHRVRHATTDGQPVTRWDGRTIKTHPVTGEDVPDETARSPLAALSSIRARPNGRRRISSSGIRRSSATSAMREALGDGYAEALRGAWPRRARVRRLRHVLVAQGRRAGARRARLQRFGFITTNSLRQTFNRRVFGATPRAPRIRCRSSSPSPIIRGSTAPTARRCASP